MQSEARTSVLYCSVKATCCCDLASGQFGLVKFVDSFIAAFTDKTAETCGRVNRRDNCQANNALDDFAALRVERWQGTVSSLIETFWKGPIAS
ncbi:hypothetical protein [Qipengyuania mesophila]|uniref:hypothetical protein n=1 Tax=Qipengyuania mesophila TaxID=2867246 RepID=UPI003512FCFD